MTENTIICVSWGDKYDRSYVKALKEQCEEKCSVPFNFYCITDKPKLGSKHDIIMPTYWDKYYLEDKGFKVPSLHSKYSINVNLLGATASGSEIDEWDEPSDASFILCNQPKNYPNQSKKFAIEFKHGEAIALNGEAMMGSNLLKSLNQWGGEYGVGREIFTGDTIIGLKGRFLFEAPGLAILYKAHRALEESLLTQEQNTFKPMIGQKWVDLIYSGLYFDPLVKNLETFLKDIQSNINGIYH